MRLPVDLWRAANTAHPRALAVLLVIKMCTDMARPPEAMPPPWVVVSDERCCEVGIEPWARRRALRALEQLGLVAVEWHKHKAPRARLSAEAYNAMKMPAAKRKPLPKRAHATPAEEIEVFDPSAA